MGGNRQAADLGQVLIDQDVTAVGAEEGEARDPAKGYGVLVAKQWYWYDHWIDKVLEKLHEGWQRPDKA